MEENKEINFEETMKKLEEIATELEKGDLDNFADAESWFYEMVRMQILCKVSRTGK